MCTLITRRYYIFLNAQGLKITSFHILFLSVEEADLYFALKLASRENNASAEAAAVEIKGLLAARACSERDVEKKTAETCFFYS